MDDKVLLQQMRGGNELAFQTLFERYWEQTYLSACRRLDTEIAKDIVQDIFISIWNIREQLHIQGTLDSYLYGAVKLRVLNYLRDEKARQRLLEKALQQFREIETAAHDLETYKEMEVLVGNTIDAFPENMRHAFLLRSENRSIRDIAAELGLAEQTVRNSISEGLKRLRRVLEKRYPGQYSEYLVAITLILTDSFTKN